MLKREVVLTWVVSLVLIALNFWLYPLGNGRDEIYHLQLIDFYAREWRLTDLPADWEASSPQAHQPPLYHGAMAAVVELFLPALGRLDNFILNSYMEYQADRYDPETPQYNRVVYVHHHPDEATPYVTTIRALQALAIGVNLLGIFFVWRTATLLFPDTPSVVSVTLAFLLITPTFWRRAMGVNNDQWVFLFGALVTWLLARTLKKGLHWRDSLALGVGLGLGLLTKIYLFPMVVATAGMFGWIARTREQRKRAVGHLVGIGTVTLLIAGGWYLRNYQHYGDFTAASVSEDYLRTARTDSMGVQEFLEVLVTWPAENWLEYDVIIPITRPAVWLGSMVGMLLVAGGLWALQKKPEVAVLLFGCLLPAVGIAVVGQAQNTHGNYSPPMLQTALPAMSMIFAAGALVVTRNRPMVVTLLIVAGTLVYHIIFFLPLYPPIRVVDDPAQLEVKHRVDVLYANGARLVGYEFEQESVQAGEVVRVKVCWQATDRLDRQPLYSVMLALVLPEFPNAAVFEGYPVSGRYPMSAWQTNTAFCEWIPIRVDIHAVTGQTYGLSVAIFDQHGTQIPYNNGQVYMSLDGVRVE